MYPNKKSAYTMSIINKNLFGFQFSHMSHVMSKNMDTLRLVLRVRFISIQQGNYGLSKLKCSKKKNSCENFSFKYRAIQTIQIYVTKISI